MKSEAGKGLEGVKMETNEKRNVPDDDVIDLREIFFAIKRKIFLIIAVGLLGGCLYGAYTAFLIDPVYTSTACPRRQLLRLLRICSWGHSLQQIIRY